MRSAFLSTALLLFAFHSKATGDTLTRAAVYNFNVGDTFQDETTTYLGGIAGMMQVFTSFIIAGQYYSQNSDTLFVIRNGSFIPLGYPVDSPAFYFTDTLKIDSLNNAVISDIDSTHWERDSFLYYSNTKYHQRLQNGFQWASNVLSAGGGYTIYGAGLGLIAGYFSQFNGTDSTSYDTALVFYSKGHERWGSPYHGVSGVADINGLNPSVDLYPTINDGEFWVKLGDIRSVRYTFTIYDITGREIWRTVLNEPSTNIKMANPNAGIYLWNVTSDGGVLSSGKLIVQ